MSSITAHGLDLDAARRESAYPDGIPVTRGGESFVLPAELPADVFDPFLSDDLDLVALVREVMAGDENESYTDTILNLLSSHPHLHQDVLKAFHDSMRLLFGADDYARFLSTRPSFGDYGRLIRGLQGIYGVSLGEAFASPESSVTAGTTPSPTSSSTTESTPAPSGDDLAPAPGSSASDVPPSSSVDSPSPLA